MICPKCGQEIPDDAEVCPHCGEELATPGQPPQLLSQIQGLIPPEPVITRGTLHAPDHVLSAADLPEHLPAPQPAESPPIPPPPPPPARPITTPSGGQALPLLAALFFLLILAGSLRNFLAVPPGEPPPEVKNAYTFIEILPKNARVLLAWDYDPATQGEMQLLAQPILQHLRRKQARVVNMSLQPFGPNVAVDAQTFSQRWRPPGIAATGPPPAAFGFIPGQQAALQSLNLSPVLASNRPALSVQATDLSPADTLDAFDLIIEFSADMTLSQQWVEQVAVRTQTPLLVVASGAVGPILWPYAQTRQIRTLIAGYPDALAYETLLGQHGPAFAQMTAQNLALLLLLVIILFAALRSLFRQ